MRLLHKTRLHKTWLHSLRADQLKNRLHLQPRTVPRQSESLRVSTMMIFDSHRDGIDMYTSNIRRAVQLNTKHVTLNGDGYDIFSVV